MEDAIALSQSPMVEIKALVSYEDRHLSSKAKFVWDGDRRIWHKSIRSCLLDDFVQGVAGVAPVVTTGESEEWEIIFSVYTIRTNKEGWTPFNQLSTGTIRECVTCTHIDLVVATSVRTSNITPTPLCILAHITKVINVVSCLSIVG